MTIACAAGAADESSRASDNCSSAAHQNGQTARGMGTFQVRRGVAHHPYRLVRGNSRAVEGQEDRVGRGLVALRSPRRRPPARSSAASRDGRARARRLSPTLLLTTRDIAAELVASAPAARRRPGSGSQPLQMDAVKRLVEDLLGLAGALAEQLRENVAQRAVRAVAHLVVRPRRLAERREGVVIALDDGRPGVDQRVVPVEQDGARRLEPGGQASRDRLAGRGEAHVFLAQPPRRRADLAVAHRLAVDLHHRRHERGGAGDEGFLRLLGLGQRERPLDELELQLADQRLQRVARDAGQDARCRSGG